MPHALHVGRSFASPMDFWTWFWFLFINTRIGPKAQHTDLDVGLQHPQIQGCPDPMFLVSLFYQLHRLDLDLNFCRLQLFNIQL